MAVDLLHQHPGRALLAVYATWIIYRDRESPTRKLPIDAVGLALLVVWIAALQIMLDKGKELDWFASTQIVTLAIVAVVGFVFFLIWELTEAPSGRRPAALRGPQLRDGRRSRCRSPTALFFGSIVLLPLWLQTQMGYTATDAGYRARRRSAFLAHPAVAGRRARCVADVDPRCIAIDRRSCCSR